MPLDTATPTVPQHPEPVVEKVEHLPRSHRPQAGRRHLDGERDAVESNAELDQVATVPLLWVVGGIGGDRALHQQVDGFGLGIEWLDGPDAFDVRTQRFA